mgnify:CR=1 FL=1
MWVYQTLDILSTITEGFCLYVISRCLCKEPRFQSIINKFIPMIAYIVLTYAMTWLTELGAWKVPLIFVFSVAILKICYKDSLCQGITVIEMFFVSAVYLTESICFSVGNWVYGNEQIALVDGQSFTRWEIYAIGLAVRLFVIGVFYLLLKNFKYKMQIKDSIILSAIFLIAFVISFLAAFSILNLGKAADLTLFISSGILSAIFMIIFVYTKNLLYLREQEQRDKMQIAQLQQQFAYYQEKMKDEERIRSIYHDLKNHLLVMENRQNTEETRQMAETLRSQIADYEDYVHTGNEFLDIILKDKAAKAREKQIDFSAMVDFHGIDFMEPLDISTIFGNAIDNAIEASENLPEYKRLITVKAERVRDMLLITIENNTQPGNHLTEGTTKKDRFVHGFGIPNIKKAVEKYGGQCSFQQEERVYRLKILIPCP